MCTEIDKNCEIGHKRLLMSSIETENQLSYCGSTIVGWPKKEDDDLKSVQSALSDLITTSATHDTFSRPSMKRGLILIGLELNINARESFKHC